MKKTTLFLALLSARHTCLWAAMGFLVALAVAPPPGHAAVTEVWVQRYNGPANGDDEAQAVAVDGSARVRPPRIPRRTPAPPARPSTAQQARQPILADRAGD